MDLRGIWRTVSGEQSLILDSNESQFAECLAEEATFQSYPPLNGR